MRPDERSFTNLLNIGTSFPDRHEGTLTEEKRNGKNRLGGDGGWVPLERRRASRRILQRRPVCSQSLGTSAASGLVP